MVPLHYLRPLHRSHQRAAAVAAEGAARHRAAPREPRDRARLEAEEGGEEHEERSEVSSQCCSIAVLHNCSVAVLQCYTIAVL